jgi:phenylalanyl-tRNA synthetase beta chain
MKVSFNWLRELVELKPGVTADSVAQQLTLVGLEVESIERRGRDVAGVVIAEVQGSRPHPGAEKLTLVRVVAGGGQQEEAEVVCGAKNVPAPGGKVARAARRDAARRPQAGAQGCPWRVVAGDAVQRGRARHQRGR